MNTLNSIILKKRFKAYLSDNLNVIVKNYEQPNLLNIKK